MDLLYNYTLNSKMILEKKEKKDIFILTFVIEKDIINIVPIIKQ
jgi:hypothetical protein